MFLLLVVFAGLEYCLSSDKKVMEVAIDAEANAHSQKSPSSRRYVEPVFHNLREGCQSNVKIRFKLARNDTNVEYA